MPSIIKRTLCAVVLAGCLLTTATTWAGPYQTTGIKVGEVSDTSAIVWTRLTLRDARNPDDAPFVTFLRPPGANQKNRRGPIVGVEYPEGVTVADIRHAVPGIAGEIRVLYRPAGRVEWSETDWTAVDAGRDFIHQFTLTKLDPNTRHELSVESRGTDGQKGETVAGRFRTAPAPDDPAQVMFTVSTGQNARDNDRPDGFEIYPSMLKLDPSFFVHTGDIIYYDREAKTIDLARYHWQRTYSYPTNVNFHNNVASYFIKDDHDTWTNDCWPTMKTKSMYQFTFKQGLGVFREQVPMGEQTYRTQRWGKDLQVWFVEGRDFRSPNNAPDGPDKTIWGPEQKEWFTRTVRASDAAFRILISPTPVVGPDRDSKHDNHSNKDFTHEGDWLRAFLASQKNMAVVCGDRHWQYMSIHPQTGVREYSCGPASDKHAGGWQQSDFRQDYHRFLKVKGGFLSATVARVENKPTLSFKYHGVDGKVRYEDVLTAE